MNLILNPTDVRVLGSLIEKEATTPDYYPLSLNALKLACNQSSNRDPVMQLDDGEVLAATDRLRRLSLVRALQKSDSRVMKYSHLMDEKLELDKREVAVMCVLMLRGPQTLAEIKGRTERLAELDSVEAVEQTLNALGPEAKGLVSRLPRQPGQKEARYAHMLSGAPTAHEEPLAAPTNTVVQPGDRVAKVEAEVAELRNELADIKKQFAEFRKQFK